MSSKMDYTIDREAKEVVVAISVRLDAETTPKLESALADAVTDGDHVTFDLAQLNYISSAGLRILLATSKRLAKSSGSMEVVNARGIVLEVLKESGFADIFGMR